MTPEIIARVDAWLASHRDWVSASRDRQQLYCEWRLRSKSWRQLTEGGRAGSEAAMSGVLLALVREAWGDPHADIVWGGSLWVCSPKRDGEQHRFADRSEIVAGVLALEAAPR